MSITVAPDGTVTGGAASGSGDVIDDRGNATPVQVTFSPTLYAGTISRSGTTNTFTGIRGVLGSDGADTITGTTYTGNAAFAILLEGAGGNDTIDGRNNAQNQISYQFAPGAIAAALATSTDGSGNTSGTVGDGYGTTDTVLNVARIRGSGFNDTITGGGGGEQFVGSLGSDSYDGGGGSDVLRYDLGDFQGGQRSVTVMIGRDGATVTKSLVATGATLGTDAARNITQFRGSDAGDIFIGINDPARTGTYVFRGQAGNDTINGWGLTINQASYANASGAVLVDLAAGTAQDGQGGTDTLIDVVDVAGSPNADTLLGSAGNDLFYATPGNDTIDGRGGSDTAFFSAARSHYSASLASGVVTLTGDGAAGGGTYTLSNVELYRFADQTVSLAGLLGNPTDTLVPTLGLARQSDSGVVGDGLTSDTTPTLAGVATPGSSVRILVGASVVGTATADGATGIFTYTAGTHANGTTLAYTARRADGTTSEGSPTLSVTIDTAAPVLQPSHVTGGTITLNFNEALYTGGSPITPGRFTVTAGTDPIAVTNASVSGSTATLTLARAVDPGDRIQFRYDDPAGDDSAGVLQDRAGNDVTHLAGDLVNNTPSGGGGTPPVTPPVTPPTPNVETGGTGASLATTSDPAAAQSAANRAVETLPAATNAATVRDAVGAYLGALPTGTSVNVSTFTPTPGAGEIRIEGPTNGAQSLVVLDATSVPPGTPIIVNNVGFIVLSGPASLIGGAGSQVVFGDDGAQSMVLGADDDTLHGGGGNDVVGSREGNDLLYGDAGDDTVFGGVGNDILFGGTDRDLILGNQDDDLIYGNQDDDLIYGNQGTDTLYGGQGDDRAFGGQGDDRLYGNLGNDVLYGNLGADIVYGNQGNDVVYGNQGADILFGGQGNDVLYGGQDADTLVGGIGDDTLVGGLGADLYRFDPNASRDLILGFSQAEGDRIALGGQTYTVSSAQNGDALLLLSGGGAVDLAGIRADRVDASYFAA